MLSDDEAIKTHFVGVRKKKSQFVQKKFEDGPAASGKCPENPDFSKKIPIRCL
jgi:hypothetical protein